MSYPLLAHSGAHPPATSDSVGMTTGRLLQEAWHWDPWILTGIFLTLAIYFLLAGVHWNRKTLSFLLGNLVLFIALISPIATIGETYLFSVHMVQHLMLEIIAVPLLLLGLPTKVLAYPLKWKPLRRLAQVFSQPLLAWLIGVGTLWLWHLPVLYNWTLENRTVHTIEHITFLISATIFWSVLFDPLEKYRLKAIPAVIYLFTAGLVNTCLAIILTFAPEGIYPYYLNPKDLYGALELIRESWGILPRMDQQMGGAVMWVLGGFVFVLILLTVLVRWYSNPDSDDPLDHWEEKLRKEGL